MSKFKQFILKSELKFVQNILKYGWMEKQPENIMSKDRYNQNISNTKDIRSVCVVCEKYCRGTHLNIVQFCYSAKGEAKYKDKQFNRKGDKTKQKV